MSHVKEVIHERFVLDEVTIDDFLSALLGVYAYTGCDTVSAFSGQGKVKALKLLSKEKIYVELFGQLGQSWELSEELFNGLEKFTCHLYGHKSEDINKLRYKIFCSKRGKFDGEKLPPCRSSLYQHCLRANYQCSVWRLSLEAQPTIPSPQNYGWIIDDDGINIKWMDCKPAPEEVFIQISFIIMSILVFRSSHLHCVLIMSLLIHMDFEKETTEKL